MKKTILWVEDFDNGKSEARSKEEKRVRTKSNKKLNNITKTDIKIFDEKYKNQVEIKDKFLEAVNYIIEKHGEYDCVILDIDMTKEAIPIIFEEDIKILQDINKTDVFLEYKEYSEIWKKFKKYVFLDLDNEIEGKIRQYNIGNESASEYIGKNAGFLLVILLLNLGFPKERIVFFSAFGKNDSRVELWEKKFKQASICIPKTMDKGLEWQKKKHDELDKFLTEKYSNEYYKTRFFVYEMYNIINNYLDQILNDEQLKIVYNPLFNYCCKKSDKKLKIEHIRDLYENLLFYFPYFEPRLDIVKNTYFNAIKQFSEPFEAEYHSDRVHNSCFRVMKLFRNWSSHNKFKNRDSINDNTFRFLFLIESLLFIEQVYEEKKDNLELCDNTRVYIERNIRILCKRFFFDVDSSNESIVQICKQLEKDNWLICGKYRMLPENMIDVYDSIGHKEIVYYRYLMDAFMNTFIDKKISYNENGCETQYQFLEPSSNELIKKELFCIAYKIYEDLKKNDI